MTNEPNKTNHNQAESRPDQRPDSDISLDWLFGKTFSAEETERRRREAKVEKLLREDEDDILNAFRLGCVDYVTIPFSINVLIARLYNALKHVRGTAQAG